MALALGQTITLDDAMGTRITPRDANLWVTQEGQYFDFVVSPGEVLVITTHGRTIIQALDGTWVDLDELRDPNLVGGESGCASTHAMVDPLSDG